MVKHNFEQIKLDGFQSKEPSGIEEIVTEVFQDPTPITEIEKGRFKTHYIPEKVKKGRSQLIDDVIATPGEESGEIIVEDQELSELSKNIVSSRISLSFDNETDGIVSYSRALTNFDREVIDAVSSLAPSTQIMTASTIYRVITGKDESSPVNQGQRKRVEESMSRCARCQVTIDITSDVKNRPEFSGKEDEEFRYTGNAINSESIQHKVGRGTTTYYKILSMPPFYRFAEKLGKVSVIPLKLLDSPVSKTDATIAMQSYLLRELDSMKRDLLKTREIPWKNLYGMANQEGKKTSKTENQRTRTVVKDILDFWVDEMFLKSYHVAKDSDVIAIEFF